MPMTLREARDLRKMTQEQLAAASGVEQSTISNLENGRIQSPSWETVAKLSGALRMKPHDLFPVGEHKESA